MIILSLSLWSSILKRYYKYLSAPSSFYDVFFFYFLCFVVFLLFCFFGQTLGSEWIAPTGGTRPSTDSPAQPIHPPCMVRETLGLSVPRRLTIRYKSLIRRIWDSSWREAAGGGREREGEDGFSEAPEAACRERPQVREGKGLARSQWGQRDLHGQLS